MNDNPLPTHVTSFSAYEDLTKCGHLYKLRRIQRIPERPGVASVAGTAFHSAADLVDNGVSFEWKPFFLSLVEDKEKATNVPRSDWTVSGRKSKDKPLGETVDVWADMGQGMLEAYRSWRLTTGWKIVTGLPGDERESIGIEYKILTDIGGHERKAFVDRIMYDEHGNLGVVDIKTGARKPHTLQLPAYAAKLASLGVRVQWGAYYMARRGTHTDPKMLNMWGPEDLAEVYNIADRIIQQELFIPRVSTDCDYCWMREHCKYAA